LFPDQIDRYGSPKELALRLKDALKDKQIKFVLNGNDPYISYLGYGEDATYFGLNSKKFQSTEAPIRTIDCMNCNHGLKYDDIYGEHHGVYHCEKCQFKTP